MKRHKYCPRHSYGRLDSTVSFPSLMPQMEHQNNYRQLSKEKQKKASAAKSSAGPIVYLSSQSLFYPIANLYAIRANQSIRIITIQIVFNVAGYQRA